VDLSDYFLDGCFGESLACGVLYVFEQLCELERMLGVVIE
jgi:hypothetical protein